MFRKILICAMFATAAGYCFAAESLPQVVTSEVFYEQEKIVDEGQWEQVDTTTYDVVETVETYREIPAWPLAGSEADVEVSCTGGVASKKKQSDNIRIVSKIGTDLVVENNFNLGARGDEWSGGANMLHGTQIPVGFADECNDESEMPLLHREVLEDDGGNVLTVSRSGRKNCGKYADGYEAFAVKMGMKVENVTEDTKVEEEETEKEIEQLNRDIYILKDDMNMLAEEKAQVEDQLDEYFVALDASRSISNKSRNK